MKRIKVRARRQPQKYVDRPYTQVTRLTIAPKTVEEAHDRQAREGRLETEHVPLEQPRRTLWRRFLEWVSSSN